LHRLNNILDLCQKHNYHLKETNKAHEALVIVDISTTIDVKGLRAVYVRATEHEKLINVMLSVLANWRQITSLVILKRNNLSNEKFRSQITFKYHDKGSMTAEIMVKWLRKILDRRSGALLAK
jgi:hypothetical protein